MARAPDYYVIGFDAGYERPFSVGWFDEIGHTTHHGRPAFSCFGSRAECIEHIRNQRDRTNPVLLHDDSEELPGTA